MISSSASLFVGSGRWAKDLSVTGGINWPVRLMSTALGGRAPLGASSEGAGAGAGVECVVGRGVDWLADDGEGYLWKAFCGIDVSKFEIENLQSWGSGAGGLFEQAGCDRGESYAFGVMLISCSDTNIHRCFSRMALGCRLIVEPLGEASDIIGSRLGTDFDVERADDGRTRECLEAAERALEKFGIMFGRGQAAVGGSCDLSC